MLLKNNKKILRKTYNFLFKILFLSVIFFILFLNSAQSQLSIFPVFGDTLQNTVNIGTEKIVNSFIFTGNLFNKFDLSFGRLTINQTYRGNAIQTNINAFRDDEKLNVELNIPVTKNISEFDSLNWLYSADSRSIGINKLERLNGKVGLSYNFTNKTFFEFSGGVERNNQVGVTSIGPIFNTMGNLSNFQIEDVRINSNIWGEYMKLNYDRLNADLDWRLAVTKSYDPDNNISFDAGYKLLNRDFLSTFANDTTGKLITEGRFDNIERADLNVNFSLSSNFFGAIDLSFNNENVDKSYKIYLPDNPISGVLERLNVFQYNISIEGKMKLSNYVQNAVLSFETRNESNKIDKKYNIDDFDLQNLRSIDNQRDNISYRTRFYTKIDCKPFSRDSFKFNYAVSLFQYDTPSPLNFDDRDEFNTIINGTYSHIFTSNLNASITAEIQFNHLVFLKAERSAMNNWNRIFRISPCVQYTTNSFMMMPQFEVLSNYTVYDFDTITPGLKSFSYRQIGYKDSIFIYLGKMFSLQTNINIRYFERGIFDWKSFSETPQNQNFEQFTRVLLIKNFSPGMFAGCGVKYYRLMQGDIANGANIVNENKYSQISIGPETIFRIQFKSGSSLTFDGWYELQNVNYIYYTKIPNFLILTSIHF
ncbi:MAG: hypothetical protein ABSG15_01465 [FCB group bacterium]|jgi:uncharacterized membrane protein (DUF485 family)